MNALLQGCGTLDQLGRRTREKVKVLMADYVKAVKISRKYYEQVISQVRAYTSGKEQSTVTEWDQPPPKEIEVPGWIREAEEEASKKMLT